MFGETELYNECTNRESEAICLSDSAELIVIPYEVILI